MELPAWKLILIIMISVILGYILLLFLPFGELLEKTVKNTVNYALIPVPDNVKNTISNKIVNTTNNYNEVIRNAEKAIAIEAVKYISPDIVKSVVGSLPKEMIDDERCIKKPSGKFIASEDTVHIKKNLPWDEKIDDCIYNLGTLDDINLRERVVNNNPKMIQY